jgi:hypothetical protein
MPPIAQRDVIVITMETMCDQMAETLETKEIIEAFESVVSGQTVFTRIVASDNTRDSNETSVKSIVAYTSSPSLPITPCFLV